MKWPLVSRAVYEALWARLDDEVRAHRESRLTADQRYIELLDKFTLLRLQGASEPTPSHVPISREVDPLKAAINAKFAGKPPQLRHAAMRQLKIDRESNRDDVEILVEIESGHHPDSGIPG